MRVDLRMQSTGRSRLRSTCQAAMPTLMILMTLVSCAKRAAEMQEPSHRIAEPALSFLSRLSDREKLPQRRVDEQPLHRAEQHRTSPPPKAAKIQTPETTRASAPRPVSEKKNAPPLRDREKEQMFQQFLEWQSRQKDMP